MLQECIVVIQHTSVIVCTHIVMVRCIEETQLMDMILYILTITVIYIIEIQHIHQILYASILMENVIKETQHI